MDETQREVDLCILGSGAAGMMASVWAGRESPDGASIIALDGAKKLGAKILVSGGGRCNVTHHAVDESSYAGSTPAQIKKVLRRWPVSKTVSFFEDIGVELKREDTGKLFPTTDKARTVLEALKLAVRRAGVWTHNPWRVERVEKTPQGFTVYESPATAPDGIPRKVHTNRLILAAGGCALPKSGSDGSGHEIARSLGHSVTGRVFPALVPLVVFDQHFVRGLAGISCDVECAVRLESGKIVARLAGPALCTHFGLSGPTPMNISRHLTAARAAFGKAGLLVNWLPGENFESFDRLLQTLGGRTVGALLRERLPERLARSLVSQANLDWECTGGNLTKPWRRTLVRLVTECEVPVVGDRGWNAAETTAGGVPLSEIDLKTMESKICPGLYICGEVLDVDGLIGGFNFQWAWASGYVAGVSAAE